MSVITRESLAKFWKGLCTAEEAKAVEEYFRQHPDDESLLDEYEAEDALLPLPEGYREEMQAVILEATPPERSHNRAIRIWAAAASVILLLSAGWLLLPKKDKKNGFVQQPTAAVWVRRHNVDVKKVSLLLPDSTTATLSPGTTIRYRKDFGYYEKREVKVEGQVVFSVAKNKEMPFIVYSEGLCTTVLGTIFEVAANQDSNQIRVRLLEGRVMIGIDSLVRDSSKHYYLSPGEEFVFNKDNNRIAILDAGKHGGSYAATRIRHLSTRADSLANWYMFNNQSLAYVFDQLSAIYNVPIQYSGEDLRHKYFIGKLEKKDSLTNIIEDIALLNHLSVTHLNGRYIIRRRKP